VGKQGCAYGSGCIECLTWGVWETGDGHACSKTGGQAFWDSHTRIFFSGSCICVTSGVSWHQAERHCSRMQWVVFVMAEDNSFFFALVQFNSGAA
jgi:hypothetical protein